MTKHMSSIEFVGGAKITGLPAAAANGEAVRYEQHTPVAAQAAAAMPKAGGTFTGTVTLAGDAASALQPATKQQVDALLQRITVAADYSYRFGTAFSTVDTAASGAWSFDGTSSYPNKLGVSNAKPIVEPALGVRTADAAYVAGAADVAAIIAGYDNVNNALAGMIASQHSMLYTGADHASIWGGSLHTIKDDTDYSTILGGTNCAIEERGRYALIAASDGCKLETGATDAEAGFRGLILTSTGSVVSGRNGVILGSVGSRIDATYGAVLAGETVVLTNGPHMGAGGSNITMGAGASATYSFAWGNDHQVDSSRSLVFGDGHRVASGVDYNTTTGYRCSPPFVGSRVHSARQRGSVVGNNMALDWTASQETTDTTTTRLSASGSSNYPTQPASSIVTGTVWVTGVNSTGVCSSFRIDFTSERIGTGTPTLRANTTTTLYNGLALPTVPTMNTTSGGIYRVQVVGLAATDIRWDARFCGHQVVYA